MLYADIDENDPSKIIIPRFEWRYKELLHSLPSSKYKNEAWFFNLSWQMCLALKHTFGTNLEIGPKLKEWSQSEYTNVIVPAYNLRSAPDAEGYPRLFPHQRADVKFLSTAKRAILANGMGSGKSQSAMSTIRYLYEQGKEVFPVLIVAPNSTKGSWKREVEQVWPGLRVTIVDGTSTQRKRVLDIAKGAVPCQLHPATPISQSTQTAHVGAATKKTSGQETLNMQTDSEKTVENGLKTSGSRLATSDTYGSLTDLHQKSTGDGSNEQTISVLSAQEKLQSSTTGTQMDSSEGSSATSAMSRSIGRTKTRAGSKGHQCTCKSHVIIVNWESLRSHSRLQPFGSVALKKCVDHGGLDKNVKPTACEAHNKELNEINFNTVIGDEIHRIKEPSSKVARAFKAATGDAEYRFAMSGTPIASSPEDLFSILNWLYPHAYPSKSKYLDRFCQTHFNSFGARIVVGIKPEMEQEFFAGLDPFLRRMPKEAILPFLPPIIRERRDVEMGAKQKKAYEQMKGQMIAELDDSVVHTTSPLTKMMRLLQFASAYAETEMKEMYNKKKRIMEKKLIVKLSDPSSKLDAFLDDIEDFGKESVIVFAQSKQLVNLLSARMTKLKISHGLITGDQDTKERDFHMANFQDGSTQFILCTIGAGGTGITLTKGSIMVFLQRDWSMIGNLQAEARGHRIGSEIHEKVQIIDYVTAGTVEEAVFEAIEMKSNNLEFILRDKELMRKVMECRLAAEDIPFEQFDIDRALEQIIEEYEEEYV